MLALDFQEQARRLALFEQRVDELIETSPDIVLQVSPGGRVRSANRSGLQQLGYERADALVGRPVAELLADGDADRFRRHVERVRDLGSDRLETVFRTKSGRALEVSISSIAHHDLSGGFHSVRSFARETVSRVERRGQQQKWERLAAVGALASKFAHEIRNPLGAVSLHVELLEEELGLDRKDASPESRETFRTILREVSRLSEIVDEYLMFGRLPGGDRCHVSVEDLVRDVVALVSPELGRGGASVEVDIEPGVPSLCVQPEQMKQLLMNLLRNAWEAMPSGGRVRVSAVSRDGWVELRVEDEGSGLPATDVEKIFDPFFTTKDGGTGLGLPLVKQVVREHGGTIDCRAGADSGAEFVVRLPLEVQPCLPA